MINTVWESRAWQLDMQLIGKVVLSAAALFLLGLAYRFYKFRALGKPEESDTHGLGPGSAEVDVTDGPRQDADDDRSNLRFRRANSNLRNGLVTDPGRKHLADSSLGTHEVRVTAQEGFETADVICTDQNDYCREVAEGLRNNSDPLQSLRHHGGDTCQKDECDGEETVTETQNENCREDPEGREMLEKSELVTDHSEVVPKNITALSSIDLSLSHQNESKHELHRFSSKAEVQMQESVIVEEGNAQTLAPGGLRGKIYDYHTESTSQSVTEVNTCNTPQDRICLQDFKKTHTEEETKSEDLDQVTVSQKQLLTIGSSTTEDSTDFGGGTVEVGAPQSELTDMKTHLTILEEKETTQTSVDNTTDDLSNKSPDKVNRSQNLDLSRDINEEPQAESQITSSDSSADLKTSNRVDKRTSEELGIKTSCGTYHVPLTPEYASDMHIDLGNCYEALCLAKKHNDETLKTAAYKIMSNDYLQVLQNPSIYGRLNATERDLILESRMKGRRFVVVADIDTQAISASQNKSSLSYYDNDDDAWHPLSQIPAEAVSRGNSMATMFNYLFVVLGCDGPGRQMRPSRRVLCYNPLTDSWKEISSLNEARPHCKLVALNGYLYAIGGECLHTVERYDPRQNRWTYVAPLPNDTFAVAHMATAYDDEIFVTGGTFRYMLLRYREREKVWKSSLVSGSKDRTTEMVACDNFLYRFDLNRNMGISVHRCNIRARIWYECATYALPYPAPFQCAVINNNIYCISRNFNIRFLAEDISPRFTDTNLQPVPSPKGVLFPLVLALPVKGTH